MVVALFVECGSRQPGVAWVTMLCLLGKWKNEALAEHCTATKEGMEDAINQSSSHHRMQNRELYEREFRCSMQSG